MSTFDAAPAGTTDHRPDHPADHDASPDLDHARTSPGDGWFVRAAGAVGDLGSPFYREERQRDVWNEASAVGMQLVLWLGMTAAAAMVWIGGATALPYAFTLYGVLGAASWVAMAYSRALGVKGTEGVRVLQARTVVYGLLVAVFAAGVVRAGLEGRSGADRWSTGMGMIVGAAAVVAGLAVGLLISRRIRGARRHQA